MNIEMIPTKFPSTAVHSHGFYCNEGESRGTLRIQFKNAHDQQTSLGDYLDVQRALWENLKNSRQPMAFIAQYIKEHFEWRPCATDAPEIHAARLSPENFPDDGPVVPFGTPNTVEDIERVYAPQRIAEQRRLV